MLLTISSKGLKYLAKWEGEVLHMYKDSAGYPTIGIGHLLTSEEKVSGYLRINGEYIDWTTGITSKQSRDLCIQDLKRFIDAVNTGVKVKLNQDQFDALVILAFNIGDFGFSKSTVLKRVNSGDFTKVPDAFRMWKIAHGTVNKGLVLRRENEIDLWEGRLA